MSSIVVDVLLIKHVERLIGRKLDALDLEAVQYGEPIFVQDKQGKWMSFFVPLYRLPDDLFSDHIDIRALEQEFQTADFFSIVTEDSEALELRYG